MNARWSYRTSGQWMRLVLMQKLDICPVDDVSSQESSVLGTSESNSALNLLSTSAECLFVEYKIEVIKFILGRIAHLMNSKTQN